MNPRRAFKVVDAFEAAVAEYTGAPYAVAVDSCTNALFLGLLWFKSLHPNDPNQNPAWVALPRRTYVGVAHAARNAGYKILWWPPDKTWAGRYQLVPLPLVDAARRFTSSMYEIGMMMCVSFQATKVLPIGRGGAILSDDGQAVEWLRRARFDGRTQGVPAADDTFTTPGWHMYMPPDDAARGLWLMNGLAKDNPDLPNDDYPDLSQQPIFQGGRS